MFILALLLATFSSWSTEKEYDDSGVEVDERQVKPFPNNSFVKACVLPAFVGAVLSLVAAHWQHSAAASTASTITYISGGEIEATIGTAATALVWTTCGVCLVMLGTVSTVAVSFSRFWE